MPKKGIKEQLLPPPPPPPPPLSSSCQIFPKGPSFGTTLWHPFFAQQPQKIFIGAFGANMNNFEGGTRAEKAQFLVKIFQKMPKDAFLGLFF